ncbi:AEC family transporter [Luteococcus sp. Sow4_B9]|uniref:AEC family transporter n=1 Tax=Luteococcus sp. Sow4_B9 TaxID=3438792 RepID=UPI003F9A8FB1
MEILVKALSLVAIILVGQVIKRLGWVQASDFPIFSNIVLKVTLPCVLVTSFNDQDLPTGLLLGLASAGLITNLVLQLGGWLAERRSGKREQAFGVINVASFNMGAFATPYLAGFMGPAAVVQASLFDIGNAFGAAGIGYAWSTSLADESRRVTVGRFFRRMFSSVVFDVYLVLVLMQLLDLRFPAPVITFTSTVGAANTFLAMLMIGIGLEIRIERTRLRRALRLLGVRYVLATLMACAVWFLPLPLAQEIRLLLTMVMFAPIAAMAPGFTQEIGEDVSVSTFMTSASILVGIVVMPLILLALG